MTISPSVRRHLKIALTVILVGLLLAWLDLSRLVAALLHVDPLWLASGIALCLLFMAARMAKWIYLARSNGLVAPPVELVRAMAFALAVGIVTPGRVGEVVAIAPFSSEDRPKALLAYVFDRLGELTTVLLFCAPAAMLFIPGWGMPAGIVLLCGSLAAALVLSMPRWPAALVRMLPFRLPRRLREVLEAPIVIPPGYWLASLATYFINYLSLAVLIAGAEPIASWTAFIVLPPVTLSNIITITIGGLGVREGLAALLAPFGNISPEAAAAAFLLSFVWTRLLPGLVGLAWTLARNVRERAQHQGE